MRLVRPVLALLAVAAVIPGQASCKPASAPPPTATSNCYATTQSPTGGGSPCGPVGPPQRPIDESFKGVCESSYEDGMRTCNTGINRYNKQRHQSCIATVKANYQKCAGHPHT